jgi:hypothetical protein
MPSTNHKNWLPAVAAVAAPQAELQNVGNYGAPGDVTIGRAYAYDGTFTVRENGHPLPVKSGIHRYSVFIPNPTSTLPVKDSDGYVRLGDRVHYFDFFPPQNPHNHPY